MLDFLLLAGLGCFVVPFILVPASSRYCLLFFCFFALCVICGFYVLSLWPLFLSLVVIYAIKETGVY